MDGLTPSDSFEAIANNLDDKRGGIVGHVAIDIADSSGVGRLSIHVDGAPTQKPKGKGPPPRARSKNQSKPQEQGIELKSYVLDREAADASRDRKSDSPRPLQPHARRRDDRIDSEDPPPEMFDAAKRSLLINREVTLLLQDLEKGLQDDLEKRAPPDHWLKQAGSVLLVAAIGGIKEFIAQGAGQTAGYALEQALLKWEKESWRGTMTVAGITALTAELLVFQFTDKAGRIMARALGIQNETLQNIVRRLPLAAAVCCAATVGGSPMVAGLVRRQVASWIRDGASQASVDAIPKIDGRLPDEKGHMVKPSEAQQGIRDDVRAVIVCVTYGVYVYFFDSIARNLMPFVGGSDAAPPEGASLATLLRSKSHKIATASLLEGLDWVQNPILYALSYWLTGGCVRLVSGSYEKWNTARSTFMDRFSNASGSRQVNGIISELLKLAGYSGPWDSPTPQTAFSAFWGAITNGRGRIVARGVQGLAKDEGAKGKLQTTGGPDAHYFPTISQAPGDEIARERANVGLPPVGSWESFGPFVGQVVTSKAQLDAEVETLRLPSEDAIPFANAILETAAARAQGIPIDEVTGMRRRTLVKVDMNDRARTSTVMVGRHAIAWMRELDRKAPAAPQARGPGASEFFPTGSFHLEGAACTVQALETSDSGEEHVIFSSLVPLTLYPLYVPPSQKPGDKRLPLYRVPAAELRERGIVPLIPMATDDIYSGAGFEVQGVACAVLQYWIAAGARQPSISVSSWEPIPGAGQPSAVIESTQGSSGERIYCYLLTQRQFEDLPPQFPARRSALPLLDELSEFDSKGPPLAAETPVAQAAPAKDSMKLFISRLNDAVAQGDYSGITLDFLSQPDITEEWAGHWGSYFASLRVDDTTGLFDRWVRSQLHIVDGRPAGEGPIALQAAARAYLGWDSPGERKGRPSS